MVFGVFDVCCGNLILNMILTKKYSSIKIYQHGSAGTSVVVTVHYVYFLVVISAVYKCLLPSVLSVLFLLQTYLT